MRKTMLRSVTLNVSLPIALRARLQVVADRAGNSVGSVVRALLSEALEREVKARPKLPPQDSRQ
jgi:hypothetical protein